MTTIDDIKKELERVIAETEARLANGESLNPDELNLLRTYRALLAAIVALQWYQDNESIAYGDGGESAAKALKTICEQWD